MSYPPPPPRMFLRHVDVVTRPYRGWIPSKVLTAELQWLTPELYWDAEPSLITYWLVASGCVISHQKPDEDTPEEPGVTRAEIEEELHRRHTQRSQA